MTLSHKVYIQSDSWKCSESPSGAHFWKETPTIEYPQGLFICKYCSEVRKFPCTISEAYGVEDKPSSHKHRSHSKVGPFNIF